MMFKLKVRSDLVEDFVLLIDAGAENTFFQLHEVLQEKCRFDPSQLVTFFSADEEWDKEKEIKMFPGSNSPGFASNGMIMRNTRLDKFLRAEEDKLIYTFDIDNDKSLYIELLSITEDEVPKTPVVRLHKGKAPEQSLLSASELLSNHKLESDSLNYNDDLGELEDLYGIYGEMTDNVL